MLGTALTCSARRVAKTPTITFTRKLMNQVTSHTIGQPIRAKPRSPAPAPAPAPPPRPHLLSSSPPQSLASIKFSIHPNSPTPNPTVTIFLKIPSESVPSSSKIPF